jgi:hypothetical protein
MTLEDSCIDFLLKIFIIAGRKDATASFRVFGLQIKVIFIDEIRKSNTTSTL